SKEDFSIRCTEVIQSLTNQKPVAFGSQTRRTLACARPLIVQDAATDWLGMHDGERFQPEPKTPPYLRDLMVGDQR
ncbi:15247_t:CDS:1, partial [Acaulospora colombiana]